MTDRRPIDPVAELTRLRDVSVQVDDARLDALAARFSRSREGGAPAVVALPSTRGRTRTMVLAAACMVAVVAISFAWLQAGDDGVVLAAADEVTVTLDDGSIVPGVAGLEIDSGSTIDVAGFVDIGGVRYGPGTYRVDDGDVVPVASTSEPSTTPPQRTTTTVREAVRDVAPHDDVDRREPSPTSTDAAGPTTTSVRRIDATTTTQGTERQPTTTAAGERTTDRTTVPERRSTTTAVERTTTSTTSTTVVRDRPATTAAPPTTERVRDR